MDWCDDDIVTIFRKGYRIVYRRDRINDKGLVGAIIYYDDGAKSYVIIDTKKGSNYVVSN